MKKYELIGETQTLDNGFRKVVLNRIRALKDFGNVKAGDIGGWIECEKNLSQKGDAWVGGDAIVYMPNHVLVIGAIGSRDDFTTFYRGRDGQIMVRCGCFGGTLDTFLRAVDKTHGSNHYADVYRAAAKVAELQINLK